MSLGEPDGRRETERLRRYGAMIAKHGRRFTIESNSEGTTIFNEQRQGDGSRKRIRTVRAETTSKAIAELCGHLVHDKESNSYY